MWVLIIKRLSCSLYLVPYMSPVLVVQAIYWNIVLRQCTYREMVLFKPSLQLLVIADVEEIGSSLQAWDCLWLMMYFYNNSAEVSLVDIRRSSLQLRGKLWCSFAFYKRKNWSVKVCLSEISQPAWQIKEKSSGLSYHWKWVFRSKTQSPSL